MNKKIILLFFAVLVLQVQAQYLKTYVNREWTDTVGRPTFNPILNPFGVQWSNSINDGAGNLITVGHTQVPGQGENILLTKYDPDGVLIFQADHNAVTGSVFNDYGLALTLDGSGNIYVCGATDNGGSSDYDLFVLKYNSSGTFITSVIYSGMAGLNDIATSILVHPSTGKVFVAGTTETSPGNYDFLVLGFSPSLSGIPFSGSYDFAMLSDVSVGMEVSLTGDISLLGASASGPADWDYTVATFDSTLVYLSDTRDNIPGIGFDQPLAFCKDASQNIYITGRASSNGINYDMRTIKILSNSSIAWSVTYDGYGLEDAGNAIGIDPNGDVIVGGFLTKQNNKKEFTCVKYDGSSGAKIWEHRQSSLNPSGNAFLKDLKVHAQSGDIYYLGASDGKSGSKEAIAGKIRSFGMKNWEKHIADHVKDVIPSDLLLGPDGLYALTVVDPAAAASYQTTKFTELEMDSSRTFVNGEPAWMKNQLIVRFKAAAMNKAAIDNTLGDKIAEFGELSYFLDPIAYTQATLALESVCREPSRIKSVKVFPYLRTTDTSAISRLGETIPLDDFWTTLLVEFPDGSNMQQVHDILNAAKPLVTYAHPNFLGVFTGTSTPGDTYYSTKQFSLHKSSPAGINYEDAMDIMPFGGKSFVHIGVFDTGINYKHEDFVDPMGIDTCVKDGWDFFNNLPLRVTTQPDKSGHGTPVAGIIGATSDNATGIAGIAGRWGGKGVSLYSLDIDSKMVNQVTVDFAADAVLISCLSPTDSPAPYDYGLHLQNHSWRFFNAHPLYTDSNIILMSEAVHKANRLGVTIVASRGNEGINHHAIPACIDDDWVISVGGTGTDGEYAQNSNAGYNASHGSNIDLAAPSASANIWTTCINFNNPNDNQHYCSFNMTSAAAPHVTGVAALLMSYLNDSVPNPKNLAPEDCEFILQNSATDIGTPGYDSLTGSGRLNAGQALKMVQKPYHTLWHFSSSNSPYTLTKTIVGSNTIVRIIEPYKNYENLSKNFDRGKYLVKTFKIDATFTHNIPAIDSVLYYWPRPSSSNVLELFDPVTKRLWTRERVIMNSCNANTASMTGYVYQVWDTTGINPEGWWPCDTSFTSSKLGTLFAYSVLTRNLTAHLSEHVKNTILVDIFPNPAQNNQTLKIQASQTEDLRIDLYDLMGKQLKTIYKGKTIVGEMSIHHYLSDLPNSLYIYHIKIGDNYLSRKFVKE